MSDTLEIGYIPLVDAAPLIIAAEIGFAAEEGLSLVLRREPSWSSLRDKLALGTLHAAHMLSPLPVAMSMGLGGLPTPMAVPLVLSVNGTVVGVSPDLAAAMRQRGISGDFMAAASVGRALIETASLPLRVGVPFPFSMHAELLYYWLGTLGLQAPQQLLVRTVPPPRMAEAMEAGEIDAFCVGEPWGSIAVGKGVAEIMLPGCAIWRFAPEKVLAMRRDWLEREGGLAARLVRAVWRAGRWLADPAHHMAASEILARQQYLDVAAEVIERSFSGRLTVNAEASARRAPRFLAFAEAAAQFPWRSQAVWMASRLARRTGLDPDEAALAARAVYRPDVFRELLGPLGVDLPGASEKLEGALQDEIPVASSGGRLFLGPDCFFDGQIFDPNAP
ncbi:MAG: CmpA/NrtA family ABC transporter substrate-binding protein [Pseudomonadota bacterium]